MADDEFHAYRQRLEAMSSDARARLLRALCLTYEVTLPIRPMMSTADVARRLRVGVDTVEAWRAKGNGPPARLLQRTRHGRTDATLRALPRYEASDVEAWIAAQPTTAGGPDPRRKR